MAEHKMVRLINEGRPGDFWDVPEGMVETATGNGNGWVREDKADFDVPVVVYATAAIKHPNDDEPEPIVAAHPAGNAAREAWAEYALSQGATDEDIAELTRDDLRDKYTPKG